MNKISGENILFMLLLASAILGVFGFVLVFINLNLAICLVAVAAINVTFCSAYHTILDIWKNE